MMKRSLFLFAASLMVPAVALSAAHTPSEKGFLQWLREKTSAEEARRMLSQLRNEIPAHDVTQLFQLEETAAGLEASLIQTWRTSWRNKSWNEFATLTTPDFQTRAWASKKDKVTTPLFERFVLESKGSFSKTNFLQDYLLSFDQIEDFDLNLMEIQTPPAPTAGATANLKLGFDLRGTRKNQLVNDRGTWLATAKLEGSTWKLTSLALEKADSIIASKTFFEDGTKTAGLDRLPIQTRNEAIRRGGFALALADYNGDGRLDMFLGTEGRSTLLAGTPEGGFQKMSVPELEATTAVKTAIFTDLNNDGWQDLIAVNFVPKSSQAVTVFMNQKGKLKKAAKSPVKAPPDYAMPAAVGDFNNDGHVDLYVGYPGVQDFTHIQLPSEKKKSPHGLYLNNGKGTLAEPTTGPSFLHSEGRLLLTRVTFPHSAIAVDYDQDGFQDLIVMDDRGGISPVFRNLGNGKFQEVAQQIGLSNTGYGMGTAVGDFNNDGLVDIVMTNVDFGPAQRMIRSFDSSGFKKLEVLQHFDKGVVLFQNKGQGRFEAVTDAAGLRNAGLGAGGAEFIDFDNDGWLDLYVVNGLWSGTQKDQDLSSLFVRSTILNLAVARPTLDYNTQSGFMKILKEHKGDLNGQGQGTLSMAGHQRNRLFRNNRNGSFTEIGYVAGVDSLADGYVVAKADLNRDGKMDLVLRNADPGTMAYTFPPVQVFMNRTETPAKALTLSLQGRRSNRDAIGTKISADLGTTKIVQELVANNGAAQSEKLIHIGMGSAEKIIKLDIHWPSGLKTSLKDVKAGHLNLQEPLENVTDTAAKF